MYQKTLTAFFPFDVRPAPFLDINNLLITIALILSPFYSVVILWNSYLIKLF